MTYNEFSRDDDQSKKNFQVESSYIDAYTHLFNTLRSQQQSFQKEPKKRAARGCMAKTASQGIGAVNINRQSSVNTDISMDSPPQIFEQPILQNDQI